MLQGAQHVLEEPAGSQDWAPCGRCAGVSVLILALQALEHHLFKDPELIETLMPVDWFVRRTTAVDWVWKHLSARPVNSLGCGLGSSRVTEARRSPGHVLRKC